MLTTYYFTRREYIVDMPIPINESLSLIENVNDLLKDLVMLSHRKTNSIDLKKYEIFSVNIEDIGSNYIFFQENGHTYHIRRITERERMSIKNLGYATDLCKTMGIKTRKQSNEEDKNA